MSNQPTTTTSSNESSRAYPDNSKESSARILSHLSTEEIFREYPSRTKPVPKEPEEFDNESEWYQKWLQYDSQYFYTAALEAREAATKKILEEFPQLNNQISDAAWDAYEDDAPSFQSRAKNWTDGLPH